MNTTTYLVTSSEIDNWVLCLSDTLEGAKDEAIEEFRGCSPYAKVFVAELEQVGNPLTVVTTKQNINGTGWLDL